VSGLFFYAAIVTAIFVFRTPLWRSCIVDPRTGRIPLAVL